MRDWSCGRFSSSYPLLGKKITRCHLDRFKKKRRREKLVNEIGSPSFLFLLSFFCFLGTAEGLQEEQQQHQKINPGATRWENGKWQADEGEEFWHLLFPSVSFAVANLYFLTAPPPPRLCVSLFLIHGFAVNSLRQLKWMQKTLNFPEDPLFFFCSLPFPNTRPRMTMNRLPCQQLRSVWFSAWHRGGVTRLLVALTTCRWACLSFVTAWP